MLRVLVLRNQRASSFLKKSDKQVQCLCDGWNSCEPVWGGYSPRGLVGVERVVGDCGGEPCEMVGGGKVASGTLLVAVASSADTIRGARSVDSMSIGAAWPCRDGCELGGVGVRGVDVTDGAAIGVPLAGRSGASSKRHGDTSFSHTRTYGPGSRTIGAFSIPSTAFGTAQLRVWETTLVARAHSWHHVLGFRGVTRFCRSKFQRKGSCPKFTYTRSFGLANATTGYTRCGKHENATSTTCPFLVKNISFVRQFKPQPTTSCVVNVGPYGLLTRRCADGIQYLLPSSPW